MAGLCPACLEVAVRRRKPTTIALIFHCTSHMTDSEGPPSTIALVFHCTSHMTDLALTLYPAKAAKISKAAKINAVAIFCDLCTRMALIRVLHKPHERLSIGHEMPAKAAGSKPSQPIHQDGFIRALLFVPSCSSPPVRAMQLVVQSIPRPH